MFCIQLDFFALTLALPDMARSFAVTAQSAQWTLSGYMLSLGSLFIVAGRIGDIVGRRRAFGTGCLLFTATMIGAAPHRRRGRCHRGPRRRRDQRGLRPGQLGRLVGRLHHRAGRAGRADRGAAGAALPADPTNIATQEVVGAGRAGEASGVVLTFLITTGGVGLAGAASIIGGLLRAGHDRASAFNTTLLAFALLALGASVAVLLIRHMLVRRGLMKPLSMAGDHVGGAARAGQAGRRTRVG
jgi:MFS family permease